MNLLQFHVNGANSQEPSYYWAGKNGDMLRTGSSQFDVRHDLDAGPTWSFLEPAHGVVRTAPLIDHESNIYLATINGVIHKFDKAGTKLWSTTWKSSVPGVPVLLDGMLFAADVDGTTFALDMQTGQELWRTELGTNIGGDTWSMAAGNGVVVVPHHKIFSGGNRRVSVLNAHDGSLKWTYAIPPPGSKVYNFLASIYDTSVLFADQSGGVYSLNLKDGSENFRILPPANGTMSTGGLVMGENGVAYVTSNQQHEQDRKVGRLTAYNAKTGEQLWQQSSEFGADNAAAVGKLGAHGLAVVIGTGVNPSLPSFQPNEQRTADVKPGRVEAFNAATGERLWSHDMPTWHGAAAGDTLQHICLPDCFSNPAIAGDGTVYIGYMDGSFNAIRDDDADGEISGDETSVLATGNSFQGSPAIGPDLLVATPCNGMHVFLNGA